MMTATETTTDTVPQPAPEPAVGASVLTLDGVRAALSARSWWEADLSAPVAGIVAADLMSDVLVGSRPGQVLLTSLATLLAVRTAALVDFVGVVFVRGKEPRPEVTAFAREQQVALFTTTRSTFDASGVLYNLVVAAPAGWHPRSRLRNTSLVRRYTIEGGDVGAAGHASTLIKGTLQRIGVPADIVRRVAVASYEAEMNVTMYAHRGVVTLSVERDAVDLDVADEGPGIPDIPMALQEGYSTATPEMREMGFGAGMGLPNMKRVSDTFDIESTVRVGTHLHMRFALEGANA
jgi:anti-sigma regulatory factor (Ser/Thr protein kinase)